MRLKTFTIIVSMFLGLHALRADPVPVKDAAVRCEREVEEKLSQLHAEYDKELEKLAQKFQSQGDLDRTVACKKEAARFAIVKTLGKNDVVQQPEELRVLQQKFVTTPEEATRQIVQEHLDRLAQAKRESTNAGNLDEAMMAQKEMEKIQAKYKPMVTPPPTVSKAKKATTGDALEDCDREIEEKLGKLSDDYSKAVMRLASLYQAQGDLEATLAADGEWKRFFSAKTLTERDVVSKPSTLRELQQRHLAAAADTAKKVALEHIEKLDILKTQLTMQGKLNEAVLTQKHIERIRKKHIERAAITTSTETAVTDGELLRDPFGQCEKEIEEKVAGLDELYLKELETLKVRVQSQGDLQKTLSIKREMERFEMVRRLSERDVVATPYELRSLQLDFMAAPQRIAVETAQSYVQRLAEMKKRLTTEGKLDDAVMAQRQIEALERKYQAQAIGHQRELVQTSPLNRTRAFLTFEQADASGLVADDDAFNPGRGDFSVVVFFMSNRAPSDHTALMSKATVGPPANNWCLEVRDDQTRYYVAGNPRFFPTPKAFDGRWHCVAMARENGVVNCYFDGKKVGTYEGRTDCSSQSPIGFGALNNGNKAQTLRGSLANCSYWSRALSPQEVIAIAAGSALRGTERGLVAYWPMDDGRGAIFRDVIRGRNGHLKGGFHW